MPESSFKEKMNSWANKAKDQMRSTGQRLQALTKSASAKIQATLGPKWASSKENASNFFQSLRSKFSRKSGESVERFKEVSGSFIARMKSPDRGQYFKESLSLIRKKSSDWTKLAVKKISDPEFLSQTSDKLKQISQVKKYGTYGRAIVLGACAYYLADVTSLLIDGAIPEVSTTPTTRPSTSSQQNFQMRRKELMDYDVIFSRNLFNSKGRIPDEEGEQNIQEAPPVPSTLPLNLIGTIIFQDPKKSMATIADKGDSKVYAVRADDEVPGKIRILEIEARKVIFLNLERRKKEYIELPEESKLTTNIVRARPTVSQPVRTGKKIEQVSTNKFSIPRFEVESVLADFNKVITQARAIPHYENNQLVGYKLIQIVPGSIYEKLGLHNDDVVMAIDGENLEDPGKAFTKLGGLRTATHLEINIKRNGSDQLFTYDIQ